MMYNKLDLWLDILGGQCRRNHIRENVMYSIKKWAKIIVCVLTAAFIAVGAGACGMFDTPGITYRATDNTSASTIGNIITFNEDKLSVTLLGSNVPYTGTYTIKDGMLYFYPTNYEGHDELSYTYRDEGASIYINNAEYKRQYKDGEQPAAVYETGNLIASINLFKRVSLTEKDKTMSVFDSDNNVTTGTYSINAEKTKLTFTVAGESTVYDYKLSGTSMFINDVEFVKISG
jgi:hypothetical protein